MDNLLRLISVLLVCLTTEAAHRVDGNWGLWTSYSECSHSCGYGTQSRWRYCNNPPPKHGGQYCVGEHHDVIPCHDASCPIDGVWGSWTVYQACSVTCGTGSKTRYRYCNSPRPTNGGKSCPGEQYQTLTCYQNPCPGQIGVVNGGWTNWSQFTTCTHSCGGGTQSSYRHCSNPAPSGGGHSCTGSNVITQLCNQDACPCIGSSCPVDGGWGHWLDYTTCSTTCGLGSQTRYRYCNSPHPAHGGRQCVGDEYESQNCYQGACPGASHVVNGGWSLWSSYSTCSKTCGTGYQTRYRKCDHPAPSNGGLTCSGEDHQTNTCHNEACPCSGSSCPVNGGWGNWLQFSHCSHTCGAGTKSRWRYCNSPRPSNGGQPCPGSSVNKQSCHDADCTGPSPGLAISGIQRKIIEQHNIRCSYQGIKNFLERYRRTGSITDPLKRKKEAVKIKEGHKQFIDLWMKKNPELTGNEISLKFKDVFNINISKSQINKVRKQIGWTAKKTGYCQLISDINKEKRHRWALDALCERKTFKNVIFVDETSIELSSTGRLSFYKSELALDSLPNKAPKPKHAYKVHMWGGISYRGRTDCCIFTGIMDSVIYQEILENNLLNFVDKNFPDGFQLYQDNDSKHKSKSTMDWFQRKGILHSIMEVPASSPDINPIENLWGAMKDYLSKVVKPKKKDELVTGICSFWNRLTPQHCAKYIDHIHKVLPEVVLNRGGPTKY